MTDMTSTDSALADPPLTDMAPFFVRYDRRIRRLMAAALCASLALSAIIFAHGPPAIGGTGLRAPAMTWGFGILFAPVLVAGWWVFGELMAFGRRKRSRPDGRQPTSEHDARNGMRIANSGFVFSLALTATAITQQVLMGLFVFGYQIPAGTMIARATMVLVGAVTIYLGNVWPRTPTPRAPERTAAKAMKVNRFIGWFMVTVGLLIVLLGLFLPLLLPHGHRP